MTATEKASWIILLLVLALVGCSVGAYLYGKHQGSAAGYKKGYSAGYDKAPKPNYFKEDNYDSVAKQYDELVTDYNNLRDAAIKYIGATQYQARQPLSCTSTTYGSYFPTTRTDCY